jgi:hypothetical protein
MLKVEEDLRWFIPPAVLDVDADPAARELA